MTTDGRGRAHGAQRREALWVIPYHLKVTSEPTLSRQVAEDIHRPVPSPCTCHLQGDQALTRTTGKDSRGRRREKIF